MENENRNTGGAVDGRAICLKLAGDGYNLVINYAGNHQCRAHKGRVSSAW